MRRAIALALVLLPAVAGAQPVRVPPVRTVATLGTCTDGSPKIVAVTDGATASDCATGAGTYDVTCYCTNGTWSAAASGGSGTVTTFSVVTANGVSASVANATTTPAATFTLGAITPTSVAASGNVTGANLSGTNTGDQTSVSGNAGTASALAADPADCSAGAAPRGINAAGVAQNCTAYATASHAHAASDITSGQLGVANGGTGVASLTAYAPVCGGTTTTGAVQSCGSGQNNTGYVWTSNGASALPSWQAASGGGTPGGSTTQVQFNDSGSFGGDAGMTYDKTTDHLTILGGLDARGTAGSHPETTVQIGNDAVAGNNYGAWGSVAIGFDTDACAAGTTNSCIAIGTDAHATTNNTLALGRQLTVSAGYGIGIGFSNIQVTGGSSIAIGDGPQATGSLSTAIGPTSTASGYGSWALGITSVCAHTSSWCIGNSATSTAANQLILGGTKIDQTGREDTFKHVYIGSGVTNANPLFDVTLHGTGASGTNVGAKDFYVAPGLATGNAASGSFIVQTGDAGSSGATAQTGSEKFRVPVDGGIRVADPGTRPACDSAHRGTIWYDAGGSGVADTFAVCGKSAADTYSWVASATF